jgi:hypothetical protein
MTHGDGAIIVTANKNTLRQKAGADHRRARLWLRSRKPLTAGAV